MFSVVTELASVSSIVSQIEVVAYICFALSNELNAGIL
jgi:hypothetical protein